MKYRAILLSSLLFLIAGSVAAQQRFATAGGAIAGTLTTISNKPVADARVELRSMRNGEMTGSTYTNANGNFEFSGVRDGEYEVVVTHGLKEAREHILVQSGTAVISMRVADDSQPTAGNATSVSIAEMKVPDKARSYLRKAEQALQKAKYDEAARGVERALEVAPDYANALTLRAILRLDQQQTAAALDDLDKAVKADPNYALAYVVTGSAYNLQQKYDLAMRVLERGIALNPTSWQAYFELAKAQLGAREYQTALRNINHAMLIGPKDYSPMHLVCAHAFLGLKQYDQAIPELEAFIDHSPKDPVSDQARQALDQARAFAMMKK
jgi:tetratricopeptide (TPR) repeat protein